MLLKKKYSQTKTRWVRCEDCVTCTVVCYKKNIVRYIATGITSVLRFDMEAWADLATALDESSVFPGRTRSASGSINKNLTQVSKQTKNKGFCRRRTKSTGNIIGKIRYFPEKYAILLSGFDWIGSVFADRTGNSSSSEGEMEDFQEQAQSSLQQVIINVFQFKCLLIYISGVDWNGWRGQH